MLDFFNRFMDTDWFSKQQFRYSKALLYDLFYARCAVFMHVICDAYLLTYQEDSNAFSQN